MQLVCFDVGGTSVKHAVIEEGKILEKSNFPSQNNVPYLLDNMVKIVQKYQSKYKISGIGLSMPGAVSPTGVIYGFSALPNIHGPNWIEMLKKRLNLPVTIENDANCAALAEVEFGNAAQYKDAIFLVLGSGVGGSIVKNRKIHHGIHLSGGEFGYMVMKMEDGIPITFSDLASTISLVKRVQKLKNNDQLDGIQVFEMAKKNDEICKECVNEFYMNLAIGIYNLQYAFDPEIVLLSGAVSEQEDFLAQISQKLKDLEDKVNGTDILPKLSLCSAGVDANLIGAYANFLQQNK